MKYCENCGAELKPNVKFCENCGNTINKKPNLSLKTKMPPHVKTIIIVLLIPMILIIVSIIISIVTPIINRFYNKNEYHIISFRDSSDNLLMNSDVLEAGSAEVGEDAYGNPVISLTVVDKDKFYKVTKKISESEDKLIIIWLDYDGTTSYKVENQSESGCGGANANGCLSASIVSQGFASDVIIQGNFTLEEVEEIVELINGK